jgi:energy-coupling factor transport system permease protein
MFAKLSESIVDKFTIDFLRNQVLKNAYGNNDTVIARLDPRILLVWYVFFAVVPWFMHNLVFLLGLFIFVVVTTRLARIAPLVLVLFCVGVFSQTGLLLIVSLFFGGDIETISALLVLTLKITIVSLASVTVFSGLDPDRLSTGLLWFGCPDKLSFSISFGYRILPILMEEFQNILLSFRLRGKTPEHRSFIGKIKYFVYQVKIIIYSFYPLMLNMAKRSRTTVEALELKGYRYSMSNNAVKKIKFRILKTSRRDNVFTAVSLAWVALSFGVSLMVSF